MLDNTALKVSGLSKKFGDTKVLRGVSFEVKEGEGLAIVGPSGCGKTTLLRLIAGLESPDEGEIFINSVRANSAGRTIIPPHLRQMGMVFQDLALWPHMSARGNLEFCLRSRNLGKNEIKEKIKEILASVGLHQHLNRYPHQLSGGEQQRLALARTLILKPKILLLDEPFSSIDEKLKKQLQLLVKNLQKKYDITLFYVTHSRPDAAVIADRIMALKDSRTS